VNIVKKTLPARRKVQKFCSTSCRVKSHHQKTKPSNKLKIVNLENQTEKPVTTG
jgi:hypothetical protein